jgi:hypothetical protein
MGFGDIDDLIGNATCDDDEEPPTLPEPGTAQLVVTDKQDALFYSSEWTLVGTVTAPGAVHEITRSTTIPKPHTQPYTARWTRQMIRMNKWRLRRLGVDVTAAYVKWGGKADELEDG